jgi:Phytanoyl-CoA dioxygenase (PhyH)
MKSDQIMNGGCVNIDQRALDFKKIEFEFDSRGFFLYKNFIENNWLCELRDALDKAYFQSESWTDQQKRASNIHETIFHDLAKKIYEHNLMKRLIGYPHRLIESYAVKRRSGLLDLHGGASEFLQNSDVLDVSAGSFVRNNQLYTLRMKVIVYLDDTTSADQGQFIYIEGSHKSAFSFHRAFPEGRDAAGDMLRQLDVRAGDALWLNEALLHGASEKTSGEDRRFLAFQFGPAFMADWRDLERSSLLETGYTPATAEKV